MSARGLPVERSRSCRTRAPRHGCQPCLRESRPRAASRRHYPRVRVALVGDTHSSRAVRPTGACRAPATNAACVGVYETTMARPPPCFLTGQGGAYSRSARNRRFPPLPRPGQRRVDGSPLGVGRRESTRGSRAESQPHAPRACTPPSQGEKILSARRAGQAGRRAGSGKRALGLRLARPPPRGEGERAGPRGTPPPAPSEGGRELRGPLGRLSSALPRGGGEQGGGGIGVVGRDGVSDFMWLRLAFRGGASVTGAHAAQRLPLLPRGSE